uniref:AlNc14C85G5459 protein n=1 Tax=Albugo laibachii Nc14 TaxID=890382 RepID=F0WFS4_9STRA|nr:AlNc14C85G5459 [Albugo laibachii Nc14]|eukprot:CCA20058.1 AlNc14C85G5459 [Albugo laibachii Nc14]
MSNTRSKHLCSYKTGRCPNERAQKPNGKLLRLCEYHRKLQNQTKRRSDLKHRRQRALRRKILRQRKKQVSYMDMSLIHEPLLSQYQSHDGAWNHAQTAMQSTMLSQNTVEDVKLHTSGASYFEERLKDCEQKLWKFSHIESDDKRKSTQKQPYSPTPVDSPSDVASRIDTNDAKATLNATEWHPSDIQLLIYFIS